MNNQHHLIIDLEFTGLDNTYTTNNEIVQLKLLNTQTQVPGLYNYPSVKPIGAHAQLFLKTDRFKCNQLFDKQQFMYAVKQVTGEESLDNIHFYGFGNHQDMYMLRKYGINITIYDLREHFQRTTFEHRIANEGSNLESVYLIVTGQYPSHADHSGLDELNTIYQLYLHAQQHQPNGYYTIMPHGHCAGMPVEQYVTDYRRAADGYRFNNHDLLSATLTNAIETIEGSYRDNDDFDFED